MLRLITSLFRGQTGQPSTAQPMFDSLETRSLLSGSLMEMEAPAAADVPAITQPVKKASKKLNLKGDYTGTLTVSLFPNALPFSLKITSHKGAAIKGQVQAATFPTTAFKGAVTRKGAVNGHYKQDAQNKGTFKAKVNADGTVSGTLKVTINGMTFTGTFSVQKAVA